VREKNKPEHLSPLKNLTAALASPIVATFSSLSGDVSPFPSKEALYVICNPQGRNETWNSKKARW
jgi:hypothetical protein